MLPFNESIDGGHDVIQIWVSFKYSMLGLQFSTICTSASFNIKQLNSYQWPISKAAMTAKGLGCSSNSSFLHCPRILLTIMPSINILLHQSFLHLGSAYSPPSHLVLSYLESRRQTPILVLQFQEMNTAIPVLCACFDLVRKVRKRLRLLNELIPFFVDFPYETNGVEILCQC
jgi:hypothetical protein